MARIRNVDIEKYFKNETNEYMKRNFKRVMSSDSLTQFVNLKKLLKIDKALYPFIIMNTSRKKQPGVH